jgi:hypothetical protein
MAPGAEAFLSGTISERISPPIRWLVCLALELICFRFLLRIA